MKSEIRSLYTNTLKLSRYSSSLSFIRRPHVRLRMARWPALSLLSAVLEQASTVPERGAFKGCPEPDSGGLQLGGIKAGLGVQGLRVGVFQLRV